MTSVRQFFSSVNKPFLLLKWKVQAESHLFLSTTVLTYVFKDSNDEENSDQELKLKSTVEGMILKLLAKEGDVVQPGSPLLMFQSCTHELILKEICAHCGSDLGKSGMFESLAETDLKVTHQQAKELERAGERRLLEERKLALLICLDKTLVDTVNFQGASCSQDGKTYCTKVRPGTRDFLQKISQYYELHFYTEGTQCYANKMAEILDPTGSFFSQRIWTWNDGFDSKPSDGNLKTIFPHGSSMVCILDSQEDFSKDCSGNVIYVKPFCCLTSDNNTGPTDEQKLNQISEKPAVLEIAENNTSSSEYSEHTEVEENIEFVNESVSTNSEVVVPTSVSSESTNEFLNAECSKVKPGAVKIELSDTHVKKVASKESINSSDGNNYSLTSEQKEEENTIVTCVENFLVNIHKAYYELYDQMVKQRMYIINHKAIPDLKNVIPYYKQSILKGVNIVFSGIFPTNTDGETSPLWVLAKSLGANVTNELVLHDKVKGTTHVIATKLGTIKTSTAKRFKHIHVITPDWLFKCATYWKRVEEEHFRLVKETTTYPKTAANNKPIEEENILHSVSKKEADVTKDDDVNVRQQVVSLRSPSQTNSDIEGRVSTPPPSCSQNYLVAALNLSPEQLKDMNTEVNEECTSEESDDDEEEEEYDSCIGTRKRIKRNIFAVSSGLSKSKWKRQNTCDIGTLEPVWDGNGRLQNVPLPFWEIPCDNVADASESDSECDYVYSEDDDTFLMNE